MKKMEYNKNSETTRDDNTLVGNQNKNFRTLENPDKTPIILFHSFQNTSKKPTTKKNQVIFPKNINTIETKEKYLIPESYKSPLASLRNKNIIKNNGQNKSKATTVNNSIKIQIIKNCQYNSNLNSINNFTHNNTVNNSLNNTILNKNGMISKNMEKMKKPNKIIEHKNYQKIKNMNNRIINNNIVKIGQLDNPNKKEYNIKNEKNFNIILINNNFRYLPNKK